MKKIVHLICLLFLCCCSLFAQDYSGESSENSDRIIANRNTAVRCLKLAENFFMNEDWDNTLKQASLGLAYDESISDLIYFQAAAKTKLNEPKADIIKSIEKAFENNNWVSYSENSARILYADLLSDTRRFEESLDVLNKKPLLVSADSEFIRIKNLYRMGTSDSIRYAREKVSAVSRIYSKDSRFPNLFFMFELMLMNKAEREGKEYKIPKSVSNIAKAYIRKIPNYEGNNLDTELMAVFFVEDKEEQVRLVKAIDSKNESNNALLAFAGLKTGVFTEQQAFELFFNSCDKGLYLSMLENFALKITEEGVKSRFIEKLINYTGLLAIDNNYDLQPEIVIQYDVGRPKLINYDFNNDGYMELQINCNFGEPELIYFCKENANVVYSSFPNVENIYYDGKDFTFNFFDDDYKLSPVSFIIDNIFNKLGFDFYIPVISKDISIPSIKELSLYANSVELPNKERDNSKVVYVTSKGKPVFAEFYENERKYAFCDLTKDFPITRNVDQDNNGVFETYEIYNISDGGDFITEEETAFVNSIFNPLVFDNNVYLMRVKIDKNHNNHFEFVEQYLGDNGKITIWDYDDDGIADSQYIRYPKEKDKALREESFFFDKGGEPYISIKFLDNVPIKMDYKNSEVIVFAGEYGNIYWIEQKGSADDEKFIVENIVPELSNGIIKVIEVKGNKISIIKVNDNIFCRIISSYSNIPESK